MSEARVGYLSDKVARGWPPDAIKFVEQLPMTAAGKVHKLTFRQRYQDYQTQETGELK